ncbi:ABC transporter ATP-binding protein [Streptomyces sp. NPDC048514]|uniref:ABC transporter ATP-binding protein n=1 Tax=Streptomyces sp. NPDC048514 TaxID=3365564 RepID=UPI003723FB5C
MEKSLRSRATAERDRIASLIQDRLSLLRLLNREGGRAAFLVVGQLVTAVWPSAIALGTGWFVGRLGPVAEGGRAWPTVAVPLTVLALLLLLEEATVSLQGVLQSQIAGRVDGRVRSAVRTFVLTARGSSLLADPQVADDVSRAGNITGGHHRSPGTAATGQLMLMFRILSAVVATVLLARFSVILAVSLLLASLLMRVVIRRQWMYLSAVKDGREHLARRTRYWTELAGGRAAAKEIRLFGLANWAVARRSREAVEWAGELWRIRYRILRHQWPAVVIALGTSAAAFYFPGRAAYRGEMTAGDLVTYLVASTAVLQISRMGMEAFDIEYGLESVRALRRLEGRRSVPADASPRLSPTAPERAAGPPEIRLDNLSFRYPGAERPLLDGLDLHIRAGETVAIVGNSGVGKTTLIKILAGLLEPTGGTLTVDGARPARAGADDWRRRLGIVFQDFVRYPLTAAENVSLGAPEAGAEPDAVASALARADALAMVEGLPSGQDTILSAQWPGGVDLSGGQWQRVAIARSLFAAAHGRDILIFDEPTAHLDVAAEAEFYQRVAAHTSDQTVVLISHRMSTIRHADRIFLMADGVIAEQGGHDELMAADGEYARLFRLQANRFTMTGAQQEVVLS